MALTLADINHGTIEEDGTGESPFTAAQKINANNALIEAAVDLNTAKSSGAFSADAATQITASTAIELTDTGNDEIALDIQYTTNKASGSNDDTGLVVNQTDTASPGSSLLQDWQTAGVSQYSINNAGRLTSHIVGEGLHLNGTNQYIVGSSADTMTLRTNDNFRFWYGSDTAAEHVFRFSTISESNKLTASSGVQNFISIAAFINQTSTAGYTGLLLDVTESTIGSGENNLMDLQRASSSVFRIDHDAKTVINSTLNDATGNEAALTITSTVNKATSGNDSILVLNQVDTASPGTSLLQDWQVGGVTKISFNNDGYLINPTGQFGWGTSSTARTFLSNTTGVVIRQNYRYGWSASTGDVGGAAQTTIYSDAVNIVAQRNAANAQTHRIYNTYTDASNYERLAFTGAGVIAVETAGTGTDNIDMTLTPAGTGDVAIAAGFKIAADRTTEDAAFINFKATADADATSAISTLTTSGSVTHHIQVEINGTTAWIPCSTTDPS